MSADVREPENDDHLLCLLEEYGITLQPISREKEEQMQDKLSELFPTQGGKRAAASSAHGPPTVQRPSFAMPKHMQREHIPSRRSYSSAPVVCVRPAQAPPVVRVRFEDREQFEFRLKPRDPAEDTPPSLGKPVRPFPEAPIGAALIIERHADIDLTAKREEKVKRYISPKGQGASSSAIQHSHRIRDTRWLFERIHKVLLHCRECFGSQYDGGIFKDEWIPAAETMCATAASYVVYKLQRTMWSGTSALWAMLITQELYARNTEGFGEDGWQAKTEAQASMISFSYLNTRLLTFEGNVVYQDETEYNEFTQVSTVTHKKRKLESFNIGDNHNHLSKKVALLHEALIDGGDKGLRRGIREVRLPFVVR